MRGVTALIIAIVLLIVGVLIVLFIYGMFNVFSPTKTGASPNPTTLTDNFNYTTYLLSENPVDLSKYDECKNLMSAIKNAIVNKNPSQVDDISYGSATDFDLASEINFPLIGDCPAYDGKEILSNIASGLEQKVCTFSIINTNKIIGDSGDPTYGGISDASGLYYDNCLYTPSRSIPLVISGNVGPDESLVHPSLDTANLYYSPDYLYIRNGDFEHSSNLNDPLQFPNAYNGPGSLKIYVGSATFDSNGNCVFNIYFCPRTAIAKTKEDSTISIFNIFRKLELYDFSVIPFYYIRDLTGLTNQMGSYSRKVDYWNYYDVPLDKDYRVETIINAIKEGMYLSVDAKNYSWAHPHWDIEQDTTLNKDNECWNPIYNSMIKDGSSESKRTRSIRFNCGNDNKCSGNLRIKIAVRRDFKDMNGDGKIDNNEHYISTVISFCDDTTSVPVAAPLCSSYNKSDDCTNAGCTWCSECLGSKVNQWGNDKCVDRGVNCGYDCISSFCGAPKHCEVCEKWDWDKCTCVPSSCCLKEGSLISTPDGFKRIEDLKEGDYVIGYKDGKIVKSKILNTSVHEGEFKLYFYKGYWFTENHLVYLDNYEDFKLVSELSNVTESYEGKIYNIQTETKNYFGENGLLIHNK